MRVVSREEKSWSWSFSKLKNYRTCPRRYHEVDIKKAWKEDDNSGALLWGNQLHEAFAKRIGKGEPLPAGMEDFEDMCKRLVGGVGTIMVEQKFAINSKFEPVAYFAKDAWYRGIADYLVVNGPVAMAIDYKTGSIKPDYEQLALMAECVFSHYPDVQAVKTEYWWIKEDACTPKNYYRSKRSETWKGVFPDLLAMQKAHAEDNFPPKPSGLCGKWCPVLSCEHNGKNPNR